jgi:hypothetical protein
MNLVHGAKRVIVMLDTAESDALQDRRALRSAADR